MLVCLPLQKLSPQLHAWQALQRVRRWAREKEQCAPSSAHCVDVLWWGGLLIQLHAFIGDLRFINVAGGHGQR